MRKISHYISILLKGELNFFHFLNCFIMLCAFVIPFIAGSFSGDAKKEELSSYITERVKDSTQSKSLMAISVSPTEKSGLLPDDEKEFHALYGVFKQENITYASGFNAQKNKVITIPQLNDNKNYSIFYNSKDSTVIYDGHYKHWYYPIEYMFEAKRLYDISRYMIYLTQSQADKLLETKGVVRNQDGKYSEPEYSSLIKQLIIVNIDGQDIDCVIGNIIYEQNYYYNGLKETLGDFIACAYYCPGNLERESFYFFNRYSYQNSYFMNYVTKVYNNKQYDVNLIKNNIIKQFEYDTITSFYKTEFKSNNLAYILLIVLSLVLLSFVVFLNFIKCRELHSKYIFLNCVSIFLPYLFFFVFTHFDHSILMFSNSGISLFVYLLIYYIGANLFLFIINKIYTNHLKRKADSCNY